jgi:hypothetical protein
MNHTFTVEEHTGYFKATCSCGWATKAPVRTAEAAAALAGNHVRDKRKW